MRILILDLADNPKGADPKVGLFKAVLAQYPETGITIDNTVVQSIQASALKEQPTMTRVTFVKDGDYNYPIEFFYERWDIKQYFTNPFFTEDELTTIGTFTNSVELLELIATKINKNFLPSEFWVDINRIQYSGGSNPPNWTMRTIYNSIWWTGQQTLWLHG